jgi:hypothetical protein
MGDPSALAPAAHIGCGTLDGAVWRPGDPVKHLGPPDALGIRLWSRLFNTRCGLGPHDGAWRRQAWGEDDDYWCVPCVQQAGIPYELWSDDDPGGAPGPVSAGRC